MNKSLNALETVYKRTERGGGLAKPPIYHLCSTLGVGTTRSPPGLLEHPYDFTIGCSGF